MKTRDFVRRPSMLSHKVIAVTFAVLLLLVVLTSVQAQPTRVVDSNTKFHRLYVTGAGNQHRFWHEENSFKNDRDELKKDLEKDGNQKKPESTSKSLEKPTKQELMNTLNTLKTEAKPGDEVTICFIGHGNGASDKTFGAIGEANEVNNEWFWLNDNDDNGEPNTLGEALTDDELAQMLEDFAESVTIVVIIDCCFGGGFTGGGNDIQESDHVAVIGPSGKAIVDPPGLLGGLDSTLTEDAADGGGEKEADKPPNGNGDGIVTTAELKGWLTGRGWTLGPPDDSNPPEIKNGKSKIKAFQGSLPLELPSITPGTFTPSPESDIVLQGKNFADGSTVEINLVKPDLTQLNIGYAETDLNGSFTTTVTIPNIPCGEYMLITEDVEGYLDWQILSIGVAGVGGIVLPIDKLALLAPYIGLASTILVATAATAIYVKRVKRRKEKQ